MSGQPLTQRMHKDFWKKVTFDGTSGNGAIGTVAIGSVTGAIMIERLCVYCGTTLVGAATLEMGTSGTTAGLIAQIADATGLAAGELWVDATPTTNADTLVANKAVADDIILTIGSAAITAGEIEIRIHWHPLTVNGNLG